MKNPRTLQELRNDPRVRAVSDERHGANNDGIWVYLNDGWYDHDFDRGCTCIHEDTVKACCARLRDVTFSRCCATFSKRVGNGQRRIYKQCQRPALDNGWCHEHQKYHTYTKHLNDTALKAVQPSK